jgi:hypothetical protein
LVHELQQQSLLVLRSTRLIREPTKENFHAQSVNTGRVVDLVPDGRGAGSARPGIAAAEADGVAADSSRDQ